MSICINPSCPTPNHPTNSQNRFCQSCGTTLLLSNCYRVTKLISDSSGFGIIYSVVDNAGTPKILKVLKGNLNNHGKAVELFEKEAEVLSRLTNPGIPKVDGYFTVTAGNNSNGETPLLHCIVMEKIDGLNLDEWMQQRQHQPITESLALEWLQQITEILHLVHQQQYFHRDIKPPNIMRRGNGQLVLIDFGTAREVTTTYLVKVGGAQHRVTGVITAGYTPQEQINGKAVPQSDFYALGRTFVFLLTGKEPTDFEEDSRTGQVLWRRSAGKVEKSLADLIDDLMQPFPGNRPKNTDEILQRLYKISRKLHPPTPPPIPPQSQQNLNPPPQPPPLRQQPSQPPPLRQQPSQSQRKWQVRGAVIAIGVLAGSLFLNQHPSPQDNSSKISFRLPINSSPVQSPTSQASPSAQVAPESAPKSPTPTSPTASTNPSASSSPTNWHTYSSIEGNFSAQFPGKPKEQKRSAQSPQGTVSGVEASYVDDANQRLYLTRQVSLPIPPGTKLDKANIEKVLDSGRDNTAKTSGATVKGETKISNGGYPGREFSMTLPNGAAAKVRIFINPDSLKAYQAIVATKAGKVDFPEADTFLESVKISN